jgi:urease accessory protein
LYKDQTSPPSLALPRKGGGNEPVSGLLASAPSSAEIFAANRARGSAHFEARAVGNVTRRGAVFEDGSLRVRFPSSHGQHLSAVLVNTAGGMAGGDRFDIRVQVRSGAALSVTTAAAEKVYRSHGPDASFDLSLAIERGGRLDWLPQETILFDRAQVSRRINIDLAEGASLLAGEMVVFGRTAMDEQVEQGRFIDRWRVRRDGRLIFADTVCLDGRVDTLLAKSAVAAGGCAIATLLIAPADEDLLVRIRDAVSPDCEMGASSWNGFAIVRFVGQNAARLRSDVIAVLSRVAPQALPRLWLQ